MLLIGQPSYQLLHNAKRVQPEASMNMMAAKNFAIKLIEESLKLVEGKSSTASFKDLAVGVSSFVSLGYTAFYILKCLTQQVDRF